MLVCVLAGLAVLAAGWSTWWAQRSQAALSKMQLLQYQTQEAALWARMLSARLDAYQRMLSTLANQVQPSKTDVQPLAEVLQRQEAGSQTTIEAVYVAWSSGEVLQHALADTATDIGASGLGVLRRTMSENKPGVIALGSYVDDSASLRVLLAVPIPKLGHAVAGALAVTLKLPMGALLPEVPQDDASEQYMLLDHNGVVLAHSNRAQRVQRNPEAVAGAPVNLSTLAHAYAPPGYELAMAQVPWPQWQAVVMWNAVAQPASPLAWSLPAWLSWGAGIVALVVLASWVLWGWVVPWPLMPRLHVRGVEADAAEEADVGPRPASYARTQTMAVLEAVPAAMLLVEGDRIQMLTPQAMALLGYGETEGAHLLLSHMVFDAAALAQAQHTLNELGSFEGRLALRKKDGDEVQVLVLAWTTAPLASASVWQLRLPWRKRCAPPLSSEKHAGRDKLTGLYNREAFNWGMQWWLSSSMQAQTSVSSQQADRMPSQGCLLFIDLDYLGMMNETTSRDMGDKILRHVGRLIARYTQPLGDVARLGGDEFAVLLPGVSLAHAQGIGQALCDAVWRWQPSWSGERHWVSISIGIVAVDALRHTPEQAVRAADMACYEAKRRGRCQVAVGQISAQPPAADASA